MGEAYFENLKLEEPATLATAGSPIDAVYLILDGTVEKVTGKETESISTGSFVGAENVFLGKYTSTYSFKEPIEVVKIKAENYTDFSDNVGDMDVYETAHKYLSALINDIGMRYMSFYDVTSLFVRELTQISKSYQDFCASAKITAAPKFSFPDITAFELQQQAYYSSFTQFENYAKYPDAFENVYKKGAMAASRSQLRMFNNVCKTFVDFLECINGILDYFVNTGEKSLLYLSIKAENEVRATKPKHAPKEPIGLKLKASLDNFVAKALSESNIPIDIDYSWLAPSEKEEAKAEEETPSEASADAQSAESAPISEKAEDIDLSTIKAGSLLMRLCNFAQWTPEKIKALADAVTDFMNLSDKFSREEDAKSIYPRVTNLYYDLYTDVFFRYAEAENADFIVEVFLDFGLLDERLLNKNELNILGLTQSLANNGFLKIYRMKDWLMSIYRGENVPSKNEFDTDYHDTIRKRQIEEHLEKAQVEALLADSHAKVEFEINNLLRTNNRLANGNIFTFVPILYSDLFDPHLEEGILTTEKISEMFNKIKALDFTAFYREILYEDAEIQLYKEIIQVEVLPVFILLPTCGPNGIMWQETTRKRTRSEARFLLPAIHKGNFELTMMRLFGRYRWEFCKKVQGVAWSDISVPSLTSEYADYIQFYRKNKELNAEKRDLIKNQIQRCRNSVKEVFVTDYIIWLRNESAGSVRLNPVNRRILATYCPFPKQIRKKLASTPMFEKSFFKFNQTQAQRLKVQSNKITSRENKGMIVPDEVYHTLDFYNL